MHVGLGILRWGCWEKRNRDKRGSGDGGRVHFFPESGESGERARKKWEGEQSARRGDEERMKN
jgi:hypothetical protein